MLYQERTNFLTMEMLLKVQILQRPSIELISTKIFLLPNTTQKVLKSKIPRENLKP